MLPLPSPKADSAGDAEVSQAGNAAGIGIRDAELFARLPRMAVEIDDVFHQPGVAHARLIVLRRSEGMAKTEHHLIAGRERLAGITGPPPMAGVGK